MITDAGMVPAPRMRAAAASLERSGRGRGGGRRHAPNKAALPGGVTETVLAQLKVDWLDEGLPGRTAKTVEANRDSLRPLLAVIGRIPLKDLTVQDVRTALGKMAATHATRTLQKAHNSPVLPDQIPQRRVRRQHLLGFLPIGGAVRTVPAGEAPAAGSLTAPDGRLCGRSGRMTLNQKLAERPRHSAVAAQRLDPVAPGRKPPVRTAPLLFASSDLRVTGGSAGALTVRRGQRVDP
jgi:hypothetical protein